MQAKRVLSRRRFLSFSAMAAMTGAVAACGATVAPQVVKETVIVTETQIVEVTAAKPIESPVTLEWWSYGLGLPNDIWPHGKWEQSMADSYMQLVPNVTIEYQALGWDALTKMATSITAGNPPHMILRGGIDQIIYALEGNCALEVELPEELKEDLPEGWYEAGLYQGKNYQIPFYCLANGMAVNLTIAKEAGADGLLPTSVEKTWKWDDFTEYLKACTYKREDGTDVWGWVQLTQQSNPFYYWPTQVLSWSAYTDTVEMRDGAWRCKIGDEEGLAWLKWMQNLYYELGVCPNPSGLSTSSGDYWWQNALSCIVAPDIGWAKDPDVTVDPETLVCTDNEYGFDWMFVQTPTPDGGPGYCWGGAKLDINIVPYKKDDNAIQPTLDFAFWLVNKEHQQFLSQYLNPIRMSAIEDLEDPMLKWHYQHYIPRGRQRAEAEGGRAREVCEAFEVMLQTLYLPTEPAATAAQFCSTVEGLDWAV